MAKLSNDSKYVTVEKGDTLSQIASDYGNGKTYKQLAAINDINNPDLIYVGQKIYLSETSTSTTSKKTDTQKAVIKQFGPQSDVDDSLIATWTWNTSNTSKYQVKWKYYTAEKVWKVEDADTTNKYATFNIPVEAKQVRFMVKPIAKKNKKDKPYWTADWATDYNGSTCSYTVSRPPDVPPVPTVKLEGLKLTAEVTNITSDPSIVEFEVYKNDATRCSNGKTKVKTSAASYSCTIASGGKYKVRCRAYKDGVYSEWSAYSNNYETIPATPTKLVKCEPKSLSDPVSIYLEWAKTDNAKTYDIQYTTKKSNFDGSDQLTIINGIETTQYTISSGIEVGKEYFFRIRSVNDVGASGWSEISSTAIGTGPAAPTTWSSTTTVISGEPLTLYWVHNSEDGSSQTYVDIELTVDGEKLIIPTIDDSDKTDKTSSYDVKMVKDDGTPLYPEGAIIEWRVRTAGIANKWGDWSTRRRVDVYAPPTLELGVTDSNGNGIETLRSLPFNISAIAGPTTQKPMSYHVSIVSNEFYETVDNMGESMVVNEGSEVYSKHFDISEPLLAFISAGDISLENGISYTVKVSVSMDSGLTAEASSEFLVSWVDATYSINAEIGIDNETFSAYIRPYCSKHEILYFRATRTESGFVLTDTELSSVYGEIVEGLVTATGEQVYFGASPEVQEEYFCVIEKTTIFEDVLLSVYRREFDGSFTEIASGLDGTKNTYVTDPHPSLDYARYRVAATSKTTGAIVYYDIPGQYVGIKSVIIQWDEEWSNFDIYGGEDELIQPPWSGSLLQLPFNIDLSNSNDPDVAMVKYIGREYPVTYYGTQVGETATWNVAINKEDINTLYALRRLQKWKGNVYVREPSGSGYWANIRLSFDLKHKDLTVPITIEITRVEGGA